MAWRISTWLLGPSLLAWLAMGCGIEASGSLDINTLTDPNAGSGGTSGSSGHTGTPPIVAGNGGAAGTSDGGNKQGGGDAGTGEGAGQGGDAGDGGAGGDEPGGAGQGGSTTAGSGGDDVGGTGQGGSTTAGTGGSTTGGAGQGGAGGAIVPCGEERCGVAYEEEGPKTVNLSCPTGQVIQKILFASYGLPSGKCSNPQKGSCHAEDSKEKVEEACLGEGNCKVKAENKTFDKDPCSGEDKILIIKVLCGVPGCTP